jgi:hypothetical protein
MGDSIAFDVRVRNIINFADFMERRAHVAARGASSGADTMPEVTESCWSNAHSTVRVREFRGAQGMREEAFAQAASTRSGRTSCLAEVQALRG